MIYEEDAFIACHIKHDFGFYVTQGEGVRTDRVTYSIACYRRLYAIFCSTLYALVSVSTAENLDFTRSEFSLRGYLVFQYLEFHL